MRINKFVAQASGMSRRAADTAVADGRVSVNGQTATIGLEIQATDTVTLDDRPLKTAVFTTILLNKPVGYICSRQGQGGMTVYDLLPPELHHLKPVGRLDKDSSGLLLMTNDGDLANRLTHPRYVKTKVYEVVLNKKLSDDDKFKIVQGVQLEDGPSALKLDGKGPAWTVTMAEGRNRQIRRTFEHLGYTVTRLHRIRFGDYILGDLHDGSYAAAAVPLIRI